MATNSIPSRDQLYQIISKAWSSALKVDQGAVDQNTNFFEAGGDSVMAFVMNLSLEETLAQWLPEDGLPVAAIAATPKLDNFIDAISECLVIDKTADEGVL